MLCWDDFYARRQNGGLHGGLQGSEDHVELGWVEDERYRYWMLHALQANHCCGEQYSQRRALGRILVWSKGANTVQ